VLRTGDWPSEIETENQVKKVGSGGVRQASALLHKSNPFILSGAGIFPTSWKRSRLTIGSSDPMLAIKLGKLSSRKPGQKRFEGGNTFDGSAPNGLANDRTPLFHLLNLSIPALD